MDKDIDLNSSGNLPDGSAKANAGGWGATAADMRRGYVDATEIAKDVFATENDGGTTTEGNPLKRGGFAGRPLGWAR